MSADSIRTPHLSLRPEDEEVKYFGGLKRTNDIQNPGSLVITYPGMRGTLLLNPCSPSCTVKNAPNPCPVPCCQTKSQTSEVAMIIVVTHQIILARPSTKPSLPIRLTDIQTYPQGTLHYQSRSGRIQIVIEVGN